MYIVCLTLRQKKKNILPDEFEFHSDYQVFDTLDEAQTLYNKLFQRDNLYSATICKPIESTEAHYIEEK